jgi:hypothetical protein
LFVCDLLRYEILLVLRTHDYLSEADKDNELAAQDAKEEINQSTTTTTTTITPTPSTSTLPSSTSTTVDTRIAVHSIYPIAHTQVADNHISIERVQRCLERQLEKEEQERIEREKKAKMEMEMNEQDEDVNDDDTGAMNEVGSNLAGKKQHAKEQEKILLQRKKKQDAEEQKKLAKPKMKHGTPLKAILANDFHFGPDIIQHCLMMANIEPNQSLDKFG